MIKLLFVGTYPIAIERSQFLPKLSRFGITHVGRTCGFYNPNRGHYTLFSSFHPSRLSVPVNLMRGKFVIDYYPIGEEKNEMSSDKVHFGPLQSLSYTLKLNRCKQESNLFYSRAVLVSIRILPQPVQELGPLVP